MHYSTMQFMNKIFKDDQQTVKIVKIFYHKIFPILCEFITQKHDRIVNKLLVQILPNYGSYAICSIVVARASVELL